MNAKLAAWALVAVVVTAGGCAAQEAAPTVGGGALDAPAVGPAPSAGPKDLAGYVLVKNWDFGTGGTIRNIGEMSAEFQYHDQFGTIANGTKYGAYIVAPDRETSLPARNQPIEGVNTDRPVREFTVQSIKTYLVALDGAKRVHPTEVKAGSGSFQAKWTLPRGGSRLGQDLIWETRVRYETPPYFWFAIWAAGNKWNRGAEIDVIESFGYDNGGGHTNFDGRYWHSSPVGGTAATHYHANWGAAMRKHGVETFDATQWHTWTLEYRADDTWTVYMDGIEVQSGKIEWTLGATSDGEPLNMSFIFDGAWGHREVKSVNHWLDASELEGKFYEWDYSRVYLREAKAQVAD